MLERTPTLAALLQDTDDRLIVTGLGSAANDVAFITDFAPRAFTMDGVMGAATSVGLARGAGIRRTMTVASDADFAAARELIRTPGDTAFVLVKVARGPAADVRIDRDGDRLRTRFRDAATTGGTA